MRAEKGLQWRNPKTDFIEMRRPMFFKCLLLATAQRMPTKVPSADSKFMHTPPGCAKKGDITEWTHYWTADKDTSDILLPALKHRDNGAQQFSHQ